MNWINRDIIKRDDKGEGCFDMVGHVLAFGEEDDDRTARFRASTPSIDRHQSIVKTEGIDLSNFKSNPIFGWGHDVYSGAPIDSVIGKVTSLDQDSTRLDIDVEFTSSAVNPKGEMARRMVRAGFLNAVSIGFYEKSGGFEKIDGNDIYVYRESELLEVSLVPIPANPEATEIRHIYERTCGVSPSPEADLGTKLLTEMRNISMRFAMERIRRGFKNG